MKLGAMPLIIAPSEWERGPLEQLMEQQGTALEGLARLVAEEKVPAPDPNDRRIITDLLAGVTALARAARDEPTLSNEMVGRVVNIQYEAANAVVAILRVPPVSARVPVSGGGSPKGPGKPDPSRTQGVGIGTASGPRD